MKVHPLKTKKLPGNNFYKAKDKRSNKEGTMDIPGGSLHEFYLHERQATPTEKQRRVNGRIRKTIRKAYRGGVGSNRARIGTNDHG